ncbi:hypothetical protein GIW05_00745 [Pseudomonas syringae]|uniref:hypothetical protein n=1 Tax=Pseudomonas syringae TaxID=317 RepID=UPI001F33556F|nr:hypothetical protein [Pseudomonas syringae]MCF5382049.1 hypothetical protein [Pseudomonas syringae]MCF5419417.1 hypothetical protein [Pseudomonas syringae]MCF5451964.1 hypothetical protein [Pseudomonas syringae]MCF5458748.1 hypothetical protein [Pseudomonas syringae]
MAAFDPQGAIAILCEQTDQDTSEYQLSDVEPVSDKHLDATEVFDQVEGKAELLKASLRQDIAKLTVPTYMYGWE